MYMSLDTYYKVCICMYIHIHINTYTAQGPDPGGIAWLHLPNLSLVYVFIFT